MFLFLIDILYKNFKYYRILHCYFFKTFVSFSYALLCVVCHQIITIFIVKITFIVVVFRENIFILSKCHRSVHT